MRCPHCGSSDLTRVNSDWNTNRVTWKCFKCGNTFLI